MTLDDEVLFSGREKTGRVAINMRETELRISKRPPNKGPVIGSKCVKSWGAMIVIPCIPLRDRCGL